MPRSNRPRRTGDGRSGGRSQRKNGEAPELDLERARSGIGRRESAPDGDWFVRSIAPRNANKEYTCPGCHMVIQPGLAHLVVWAHDHIFGEAAGIAERRHWHTNCWRGRTYKFR